MIKKARIVEIAEQLGMPANTVDKDYVIGHFLNELFNNDFAQGNFIFKGGTCLKKCYFGTYRFSEDIDITVRNAEFDMEESQIRQVCDMIRHHIGIAFEITDFKIAKSNDRPVGWDCKICFWGANHSINDPPRFGKDCHTSLKLELRHYEKVMLTPNHLPIIHAYEDKEMIKSTIPCYPIEEILGEKLRSLIQRNRGEARDYFDLWYIGKNIKSIDWEIVIHIFRLKCEFKRIQFRSVDDFFQKRRLDQVKTTWNDRLSHQIPKSIDVDVISILEELEIFLKRIF